MSCGIKKCTTGPVKKCCRLFGRKRVCHPRFCGGSTRPTTCRPPNAMLVEDADTYDLYSKTMQSGCGIKKCTLGLKKVLPSFWTKTGMNPRFCGPQDLQRRPPKCYAGRGCRYIRPVFKNDASGCGIKKCTTGPVKRVLPSSLDENGYAIQGFVVGLHKTTTCRPPKCMLVEDADTYDLYSKTDAK